MDLGLKGKKVILTGGSRGIGRAALEIFAEEGADVAFFSRNAEQVAETVAALSRHGGKVIGEAFDMSDLDAYAAWLKSAAEKLGHSIGSGWLEKAGLRSTSERLAALRKS